MTQELSYDQSKRALPLIHFSLIVGIILVNVFFYFSMGPNTIEASLQLNPISMGILVLSAMLIYFSNYMFSKTIQKIGTDTLNATNTQAITAAYILKWSLLEAVLLINSISIYFILPPSAFFIHLLMILFTLAILIVSKAKT